MTTDLARTHYPDAIVARAVVLAAEGHSIRRVETTLAKEFPDEVTPSREAVRRWAQAYADTCREEEGDRVQRIITLADDAVVAGLHGARDSEHPEKYIIPANAVAGTYRDKRDRAGGNAKAQSFVTIRTSDGTIIEAGSGVSVSRGKASDTSDVGDEVGRTCLSPHSPAQTTPRHGPPPGPTR